LRGGAGAARRFPKKAFKRESDEPSAAITGDCSGCRTRGAQSVCAEASSGFPTAKAGVAGSGCEDGRLATGVLRSGKASPADTGAFFENTNGFPVAARNWNLFCD
jgi:hypothetical protein